MKKSIIIAITIVTSLISSYSYAGSFRVESGIGSSISDIDDYTSDSSTGWTAGVGYDFNRIVGMSLRYTKNDDNFNKEYKVDTQSVLAAIDIGYEFKPNKTFSIKPYALLGLERMDVDFTQYFNRYLGNIDLVRSETKSETQNVFALGGGVRMAFNDEVTLSVGTRVSRITEFERDIDVVQSELMIGYKF